MSNPADTPLPLQLCRLIDSVCDAFEQQWMRGERPAIEAHLGSVGDEGRGVLLGELVRIELEWRHRRGERPNEAEYATRFPDCSGVLGSWLAEARSAVEEAQSVTVPTPEQRSPDTSVSGAASGGATATFHSAPPRSLGEYDLLGPLGAGGMGEVYRARHRRLDKLVALKLLPGGAQQSPDRVSRFLREIKAIGNLDHINVVEAHDAGEEGGVVYLAMKLIEGIDLGRLVKDRGPLPVAEACEAARQTAVGLDYLHRRGLVHRDLKPSNLMRTPESVIKVLDLGLARWETAEEAREHLTAAGSIMGTPDYMAPEQIGGTDVDHRADLYGLGGVLFFLLIGRPPFAHRKGLYEKLDAQVKEPPPDLRSLRPDVPAELANLVAGLLAKAPEQRPQSAAEVAAALARFTSTTPTATPIDRAAAIQLAPNRRRRRLWPAWIAAASLLALLATVATLAFHANRSDRLREGPPPDTSVLAPVRVVKFDVKHFASDRDADGNARDRKMGILGEKSFETRLGDSVEIEVDLSREAYAFLIAFRPDGKEEVCAPDSEDDPPAKSARLEYPPSGDNRGVNYGLDEGEGLQAFAVVMSSNPLPSYREWQRLRGPSIWDKHPADAGTVWQDQGDRMLDFTTAYPRSERSKKREVKGKTPLAQLTDWLRKAPGVETVATIGFAVLPKDKR
jgi:hypothetical protein